jgi:hypothetical protein
MWAKNVLCAIPQNIHSELSSLFKTPIDYTHTKVIIKTYPDNKKTLKALQNKKVKFAIIRSDILWHLQQGSFKWRQLRENYITISTLPFKAQLYLVRSHEYYDMDLENLKTKEVSVGSMGESNAYLLKSLLNLYHGEYTVHYKSIPYNTSLKALDDNEIDAFFGFLPPSYENDSFHFQSIFSEQTTTYLEHQKLYNIDYNGIYVSYTLVASKDADDEEIENIIYRLEERGIFEPQTDEHYGPINRYVLQHLAQIRLVLSARAAKQSIQAPRISSQTCLTYHYGFLDLLRRKPAMKKKLRLIKSRYPKRYTNARKLFYEAENILLNIDAQKQTCDLNYIKQKKRRFKKIIKNISSLTY